MDNLSPGQRAALTQLEEIAASPSDALRIVKATCREPGAWLYVDILLSCDHITPAPGTAGIRLMARERFTLSIPTGFPFDVPTASVPHTRFADRPHVQQKKNLCLYQATSTEWKASDGMYGFIDRLNEFLKQAISGPGDALGDPIHPPAAFPSSFDGPVIVVKPDAPKVDGGPWKGFAEIASPYPHLRELVSWRENLDDESHLGVAPAFFLAEPFPFEYPEKVFDLLVLLSARGIPFHAFVFQCLRAVLRSPPNTPITVLVGTPMRGISGSTDLKQHITAWSIPTDSPGFKALSLAAPMFLSEPESPEEKEAWDRFVKWAASGESKVSWIPVYEERPEIIVRRDRETAMDWFRDKTISLWGCGAIGTATAEILVRAGVKKLNLCDNGRVRPGILVRQFFEHEDLGKRKTEALSKRLLRINPHLEIATYTGNLLYLLDKENRWMSADMVIDSTGANNLLSKLELVRKDSTGPVPQIVSMAVGHLADRAMLCISPESHTGGPSDVVRRAKIKCASSHDLSPYAEEFFPADARHKPFQPEPGCSEPTFTGSMADVLSLASRMLLATAESFKEPSPLAQAHFFSNDRTEPISHKREDFFPDIVVKNRSEDIEIRVAVSAWKEILANISKSRSANPNNETGGALFGELDEASRVLWVSDASSAPPDSISSPSQFLCGTLGLGDLQDYYSASSRGSVQCIGLWHTHPGSAPLPSQTDYAGMEKVLTESGSTPRKSLLFIVGDVPAFPSVFASIFSRGKPPPKADPTQINRFPDMKDLPRKGSIGLALSGGGARAMAFHLGCLRALHHRGILSTVDVLSTISGGSVLGAMYAYASDDFPDFEKRVLTTLRSGFQLKMFLKLLHPWRAAKCLATIALSGTSAIVSTALAFILKLVFAAGVPNRHSQLAILRLVKPPFRRWYNRSNLLERVLSHELFGEKRVSEPGRNNLKTIITATELSTGTAFRFGSTESGNWRLGRMDSKNVLVSEAVAASACYPVALPIFDRVFSLINKGSTSKRYVRLTDGGIYDNLGTTPLQRGRVADISTNVIPVDYLIACNAGAGPSEAVTAPYWWPSRMTQSFETVFRRVQDSSLKILFSQLAQGEIRGFILPYLGQDDRQLPAPPPDLVPRNAVANYPTNFRGMSRKDIELISLRGEQLTRLLVNRYCPDL